MGFLRPMSFASAAACQISILAHALLRRGVLKAGIACVQQHPQNILSAHFGRYRDFGLYTDSLALYGKRMFYYVWDVPIFCLMGAVGGLMGALWVHVNVRVTAFRHRTIPVRCVEDRLSLLCLTLQGYIHLHLSASICGIPFSGGAVYCGVMGLVWPPANVQVTAL